MKHVSAKKKVDGANIANTNRESINSRRLPRSLSVALATVLLAMVSLAMSSCSKSHRNHGGENTTEHCDDTAAPTVIISVSDLEKYRFVRPEEISTELSQAFVLVHNKFDEATGGYSEQADDYYREDIPELAMKPYEILVGDTNRPESQAFISTLRTNDYGYAVAGTKIVIAGGNDSGTAAAVDAFVENIIKRYAAEPEREVFISTEDDLVVRAEYQNDSLELCGSDIRNWTIVYPQKSKLGERSAAARLIESIGDIGGFTVNAVSDKNLGEDVGNIISIGITSPIGDDFGNQLASLAGRAFVGRHGDVIMLGGDDPAALLAAVEMFKTKLAAAVSASRATKLDIDQDEFGEVSAGMLTAMSFNNLVSSKTDARTARVVGMVLKYLPDTVGFQETDPKWMKSLKAGLSDIYDYVGEGRDGGNSGEYNPIFYNRSKFMLVESGTRWLSDTPGKVSKYAESSLNRIYTYALLECRSDGKRVMVINTHLDHKSADARAKQIKVLLEFAKSCGDVPIIISGDFNTDPSSGVYGTVISSGLVDSSKVAMQAQSAATFTSYGNASKTIDFIFVSPAHLDVAKYSVCNEMIVGDYPSDHHPVLIEYMLKN